MHLSACSLQHTHIHFGTRLVWHFLHMYCLVVLLLSGCSVVHIVGEYFFLLNIYVDFLGMVFLQSKHVTMDSFDTALWHLLHIMLSFCGILFSAIVMARLFFPYVVLSKWCTLSTHTVPQDTHFWWFAVVALVCAVTAYIGIFSAMRAASYCLQINSLDVGTENLVDSASITVVFVKLYRDSLEMIHLDLRKSVLWQHVQKQWFVQSGFWPTSIDVKSACVKWLWRAWTACVSPFLDGCDVYIPFLNCPWHCLQMNSLFLNSL